MGRQHEPPHPRPLVFDRHVRRVLHPTISQGGDVTPAARLALILSISGHTAAMQTRPHIANARAFLSLAKTQRTLAATYAQWAAEEAQKNHARHQKYWADEARRLRSSSAWNLDQAVRNTHA